MKICNVQAIPLHLALEVTVAARRPQVSLSCVVVRVDTDDGRTGCGFTSITEEEVVASAINEVASHHVVGMSAFDTERIWDKLYWLLTPRGQSGYGAHAIAALDVALWGLKAQALGLPLWRLLGGARNSVPVYATCGFGFLDRDGVGAGSAGSCGAGLPQAEDDGRRQCAAATRRTAVAGRCDQGGRSVANTVPARTPRELTDWIKANPAKVNYGTGGTGNLHHLSAAMFQSQLGLQMEAVHYKGSAPALIDLAGGQIQLMFETMPSAVAQVKAGRVRPIAVTTASRVEGFPEIPTLHESVAPWFDIQTWYGVFAPARTPPEIVAELHRAITQVLKMESTQKAWKAAGVRVVDMPQPEFQKFWVAEVKRWGTIAKTHRITVD